MFIINFCLNMFRTSLCPSSVEQRPCYCVWCVVPLSVISEFFTVHTAMVYVIRVCWQLDWRIRKDTARKLSPNLYDIYNCCVYSENLLMMYRGTVRNMLSFIPKMNLRNYCMYLVLFGSTTRILQESAPQPLPTTCSRTRTTHQTQ